MITREVLVKYSKSLSGNFGLELNVQARAGAWWRTSVKHHVVTDNLNILREWLVGSLGSSTYQKHVRYQVRLA